MSQPAKPQARDRAVPSSPQHLPVPLRFQPAGSTPFAHELRDAAQAWLDEQGDHRQADVGIALKALVLGLPMLVAYAALFQVRTGGALVGAYVAFQVFAMMLAMNLLHDAAHEAVFKQRRWNRWVRRLCAVPVGIDSDYWTVRHVHFHHTWANVAGHDLDIEPNAFLRQSPFHAWAPQYRYQHHYWPLVAALSLPYLAWYSDWVDRFGVSPVGRPAHLQGPAAWGRFLLGKLAHMGLVLALPVWVLAGQGEGLGLAAVLGAYLMGQLISSCFLVAMILGTHWAEVRFYQPAPDQHHLPHTWFEHSLYTACDWWPRPAWLGYWLGGLHLHLTHHLFPTWNHRHYPNLAPLVARLARAHGLPYRALSYGELWAAQQRFLRAMGQPPD